MARTQRVVVGDNTTSWTVLSPTFEVIEPAETYLEFLRQQSYSPNTVKSYARGLALWWSYLERSGKRWDTVELRDFGRFIQATRSQDFHPTVRPLVREAKVQETTVALRLRSVLGFYRYQAACGRDVVPPLFTRIRDRSSRYIPFLRGVGAQSTRTKPAVRVRLSRKELPLLTPSQISKLLDTEAIYSPESGDWQGDLRYRLLWSLLAETGMRIGEALSLQHRDWQMSRSKVATVAIVPRQHPHGIATKSGHRRIHIGSRLDRLYSDYVWWLCDRGADAVIDDWDNAYIFCNTLRGNRYAPLRVESVYLHLRAVKRRLPDLPEAMTPHWFRHTHASALLLTGTPLHVVSRRLGHQDVQTTMNTYGHVTEDAELEALANWREFVGPWNADSDDS